MSDDRRGFAITERGDEPQHIAHAVQQPERPEIIVVIGAPSGRPAIAAQIRRNGVKPGFGEGRHDLAPGIGDLRKSVQQDNERPAWLIEPGFEDDARRGR